MTKPKSHGFMARPTDGQRGRFPEFPILGQEPKDSKGAMLQEGIENTLVLIKPDAISRGIVGECIRAFEKPGLKIVEMQGFNPAGRRLLEQHYKAHRDKPFFANLIEFMQDRLIALIFEGHDAIARCRSIAGATNGGEQGTLRWNWGVNGPATLVHTSESAVEAAREIGIWF